MLLAADDPDLPEVEVSDQLPASWDRQVEPDWNDRDAILDYLVDSERALAAEPFDDAPRGPCGLRRSQGPATFGPHYSTTNSPTRGRAGVIGSASSPSPPA